MTHRYPYYYVDLLEPGFVHIEYEELRGKRENYKDDEEFEAHGIRRNDHWFERQNLPWVVNAIQDCISVDRMGRVDLARGDDRLFVREWGSDHEPQVCIINERLPECNHPGGSGQACCMQFPLAAKLLAELDALVTWDASAYAIANAPVPSEFAGRIDETLNLSEPRRGALSAEVRACTVAHLSPAARGLRLVDGLSRNWQIEIHYRHGEIMVFVPRNVTEPKMGPLYGESPKFVALLRFHQPFETIRTLRRQLATASQASATLRALADRITSLYNSLAVAASAVEYGIYDQVSLANRAVIVATIEAPLADAARELPQLAEAIATACA